MAPCLHCIQGNFHCGKILVSLYSSHH
jgi:hypothetical protein